MSPLSFVLDLLFPSRCVSCERFGEWWCEECRASAGFVYKDLCPSCAATAAEHECPKNALLDGLVAASFYHAPEFREMLYALKYQGVTCVMPSVAEFIREWLEVRDDPWPWTGVSGLAIQPLPAAPNRVRERGFDQSALIAQIIQAEIAPSATSIDVLLRASSSTAQAQLEHGEIRDANIRGVFSLRQRAIIPPNILLIDDVVTTGSTMREAAKILKEAGAQKVYGIALAVGA